MSAHLPRFTPPHPSPAPCPITTRQVAVAAAASLASGTRGIAPSDLDDLLGVAAKAARALAASATTPASGARRLLTTEDAAAEEAAARAAALDALTRSSSIAAAAQSALLQSLVAGESAAAGDASLAVAAALVVDDASVPIGSSGASARPAAPSGAEGALRLGLCWMGSADGARLPATAPSAARTHSLLWPLPPCPTGPVPVRLSYQADSSALLAIVSASVAAAPSTPAGRRLLVTAPSMTGATSTRVVSGYVNVSAAAEGAGGSLDLALPLDDAAYVAGQVGAGGGPKPGLGPQVLVAHPPPRTLSHPPTPTHPPLQPTACLRLDSGLVWRSDGVSLTGTADGVAHCLLTATSAENQVGANGGWVACMVGAEERSGSRCWP